jgi:hypothetical protein
VSYPPFGCNQKNKKVILSSIIDAHLLKSCHDENTDAQSAFEAMIITPIFEAWRSKMCPMTLPWFDADKKTFTAMSSPSIY